MKRLFALCLALLCLSGSAFAQALPDRTAVLFSSLCELWQLAGGTTEITVGESVQRGFAEEDTVLVDDGAGKTINLELLIEQKPDLVLCSADIEAQVETAQLLENAGIRTLTLKVESFADYLSALETLTGITGREDAYQTYGLDLEVQISELLGSDRAAAIAGQRILFVRAGSTDRSTKAKTAQDHFACAMLEELGCINIADQASLLTEQLSLETILVEDPDFIFFSIMGDEAAALAHIEEMLSGQVWSTLRAVQSCHVVILPKDLFHFKPNARWPEAYEYLLTVLEDAQ